MRPCCHPERSEGPRKPSLTHTARTFQPSPGLALSVLLIRRNLLRPRHGCCLFIPHQNPVISTEAAELPRRNEEPCTPPQNKLQNPGAFFSPEKRQSIHHVYHAFHHNLTTKKPHPTTHFFQNTLQNTSKNKKPRISPGLHFFRNS